MWFQNKSPERDSATKRAVGSLAPSDMKSIKSGGSLARTLAARVQRVVPDGEDFGPLTVPPPVMVGLASLAPPSGSSVVARHISDAADAPKGILISAADGELPLNESDRKSFAIIRTGANTCALLVTEREWGSAHMFEQRRRVRELGVETTECRADAGVLSKLYDDHHPVAKSGRVSGGDVTDAEKMIWDLIDRGAVAGASDIHIESRGGHADVFFRVHGERQKVVSLRMDEATSAGRVLYTVYAEESSKDAAWDPNTIQDAVIEHTAGQQRLQLRFASGPIYPHPNFHIVIRILRMSVTAEQSLEDMGYTPRQAALMDDMLAGARGAVVMVGPTNSGKSTTLQAMLARVFKRRGPHIKMITAEDPVEYIIPGAVQIAVPRKRKSMMDDSGSAFTSILKGALRQDPDVLMVGEMRDRESAALVKDAVLTGRKLFTTLHANSAVTAFVRLREIGVEWDVLTSPGFISGIIYQRLLPTLCPHCKISIKVGAHRLEPSTLLRLEQVVSMMTDHVHVRGDGCEKCNGSGYSGRTVCAEILTPDATFLRHMANNDILQAEQHWLWHGDMSDDRSASPTVLAHALTKMRAGLIDPKDIELQVDALNQDGVRGQGIAAVDARRGAGERLMRRASEGR